MKLKKFSYKKVISTNLTAIRLIRVGKSSGFVTSEIQSKGRGQRGNKWISKYGNIFISVFFSINQKISIQNITKKNLNIVKKIIRKYVNKKIEIKSPNDILIEKSKVCGILQETLFRDELKYLIVGVGINLANTPHIPNYPTTYLNKYSKKKINKLRIINDLKLIFEKNIKNYR